MSSIIGFIPTQPLKGFNLQLAISNL